MSGGKGGGQTTKTEIPEWAESATKRNLARAEEVQKIGYMPYYGPDIAAFTPSQQAAMQNNLNTAAAFGMAAPSDAMAGMPQAEEFAGGMQGYSSGKLFDQAVAEFEAKKPDYAREYNELFAGPQQKSPYANPFLPFMPSSFGVSGFNAVTPSEPGLREGRSAPVVSPKPSAQMPSGQMPDFAMPSPLMAPSMPAASMAMPQIAAAPAPQMPMGAPSSLMNIPVPQAQQMPPAMMAPQQSPVNVDELVRKMRGQGR